MRLVWAEEVFLDSRIRTIDEAQGRGVTVSREALAGWWATVTMPCHRWRRIGHSPNCDLAADFMRMARTQSRCLALTLAQPRPQLIVRNTLWFPTAYAYRVVRRMQAAEDISLIVEFRTAPPAASMLLPFGQRMSTRIGALYSRLEKWWRAIRSGDDYPLHEDDAPNHRR